MPALTGVLHRLAGRPGDRGAVAVTVSLLLGSGVLLGFLALVVDVGQIYVERAQLQTSADAAALGVAKVCANGAAECDDVGSVRGWAQDLADANASDAVTRIDEICGRLEGILDDCSPDADNATRCLGSPPAEPQPYVEVRVRTELPDGRFVLPPTFAQAMAGNEDYQGTAVGACARASWEITSRPARVLALTVPLCEYDDAMSSGHEHTIDLWTRSYNGTCHTAPRWWEDPDRAALLNGRGSDCERGMPDHGRLTGKYVQPGDALPAPCADRLAEAVAGDGIVYLPVHDAVDRIPAGPPTGSVRFHHTRIATFRVTGYDHRSVTGTFLGSVPLAGDEEDRIVRLIG